MLGFMYDPLVIDFLAWFAIPFALMIYIIMFILLMIWAVYLGWIDAEKKLERKRELKRINEINSLDEAKEYLKEQI